IDDARFGRNLTPVVEPLAPVVQSPDLVQFVHRLELVLEVLDKPSLNIGIGRSARRSFIVDLPTDDRWVVFVVLEQLANHALTVGAVNRVHQVRVLPETEGNRLSAEAGDEDLRMLLVHPRRNRVSGGPENNFDSRFLHAVNDAIHPGIFEPTVLWLPQAPTRFAHAHYADARLLH